jgi:hypothetical protein
VGYLISASGHPQLSKRISANMNTHYLKDMEDESLTQWVISSGFTLNELAWIQPGYPVPVNWDALDGGMDGPVHTIVSDGYGGVYAAGIFDTAGGHSAHNAAHWYSGFAGFDWTGLNGSGTDGPVYDILMDNNEIYLAGAFSMVDTVYTGSSVVKWNGSHWEGLGQFYIGGMLSYINDLELYRDTLYAGGLFRSDIGAPGFFTNLAKWDGQNWVPAFNDTSLNGMITGEVKSLHVQNGELFVAGDFQLGNASQTMNIFKINGNTLTPLSQDVPYAINDLATYGGELYAACKYYPGSQFEGGLIKYDGITWHSRVQFTGSGVNEVLVLEETPDGLALGGNFYWDQLLGFFVVNAGLLTDSSNTLSGLTSLGILDSTVTSLHYDNGFLYQGGHFKKGLGTLLGGQVPLGHIAKLEMATIGLNENNYKPINVYPNPSAEFIIVEMPEGTNPDDVALFSLSGQRVNSPMEILEEGVIRLNTSGLPTGNYTLQVNTMDHSYGQQILVRAN